MKLRESERKRENGGTEWIESKDRQIQRMKRLDRKKRLVDSFNNNKNKGKYLK